MDPEDVEDIEAAEDGAGAEADADDADLGEGDAGGARSRTFRCDGHALGRDARGEPFPTRASYAAPAAPDGRPVVFMPSDVEEINEYVRGVPVYTLRLYGALEGGAKVSVTLTDIHVFFDVCGFAGGPRTEAALRRALSDAGVLGVRIATVMAFADRGPAARAGRQPFWRVTTDNLQQRRAAIEAARAAGFETKSDDRSSYYRKAARELGLPLSGWAELRDYAVEPPTDLCAVVLRAPAAGCRPAPPAARVDRTLVLAWDIETYSDRRLGDLPLAAHDGDRAFMICLSAHWAGEAAPLVQVCLVDVAARPDPRWLTVECGDAANVLRAFALCWRALAPDVVAGFNDSAYDWPFVVEKARRHHSLAWMWNQMSASPRPRATDDTVYEWSYQRDKKIKITAEEVFVSSYLRVPGAVAVDVRVCFKKLYPKAETGLNGSLKFYLAASGLAGKADMPIKLMWRHYEAALAAPGPAVAERMRHVAHYCVVDAARCQALLVRRNVLGDLRGVADLAYVSLADAHYYAGGLKVCNLLAAHAWRRDILVGMAAREGAEAGKYPGAYVFPPEKGLIPDPARAAAVEAAVLGGGDAAAAFAATAADRPVVGLDFASLYPSLIMAYNLSPEKIVTDPAEAARLRAAGEELHAIESEFNGRPVRGWSVRHGGRPADIGLFPSVLIDLFARRRAEKAVLARHAAVKELAEGVFGRARADGRGEAAAMADMLAEARAGDERQRRAADALAGYADAAALRGAYGRACFDWTCSNSRQGALKLYMNSFYGEAGNRLSPFFLLELAVGVTAAGQMNIKRVADFVTARGFRIRYGDTDSLYLSPGNDAYADCDGAYAAALRAGAAPAPARLAYWTAMVLATMRDVSALRDDVNAHLAADNGTAYLQMAYEEVLFPVVFTGKKKYYGVPHADAVNFFPEHLFVRGIDVVKQGQPGLAREIGYRIMNASVSPDNRRGLRQIVEDTLRDAVTNGAQWGADHFVKTDAWRPDKNNQPVQRFMGRMRAAAAVEAAAAAAVRAAGGEPAAPLYELPEPGERFSYVIVATGAAFDLQGRKIALKKGDRMAFARVAKAQGLEIDVAFYMVSYVVGLCARFINGEFAAADPARADELQQAAAKKHLERLVADLGEVSPADLRRQGLAYRRAFAPAARAARAGLVAAVGAPAAGVLHGPWLSFEHFTGAPDELGAVLWAAAGACAESRVAAGAAGWCAAMAARLGILPNGDDAGAPGECANLYRATAAPARRARPPAVEVAHASALDRIEAAARAALAARGAAATGAASLYEAELTRWVELGRLALAPPAAALPLGADDAAALLGARAAWLAAVGVQTARLYRARFEKYLAALKDRRTAFAGAAPAALRTPAARASAVLAAGAAMVPSGAMYD